MKMLIYITMFLMSGIWFTSCKTSHNIDYTASFYFFFHTD